MPARRLLLSTLGAVVAAFICGLVGSGLFDAVTGSGTPNPGGAIGAVGGAMAGGYLTLEYLTRRERRNDGDER